MTWPRLWRLFQEPRPGTVWVVDDELREVWYVEGQRWSRYVVSRMPRTLGIRYSARLSVWAWRRWWVFAREVRP